MRGAFMSDATIQWVITSGSVLFAFGATLWAVYEGLRRRIALRKWAGARRTMDATMARADVLFRSDPDLTLIWDEGMGEPVAGIAAGARRLHVPDHVLGRGRVLDLTRLAGAEDEDGAQPQPASLCDRFEAFLASLTDAARTELAQAVDQLRGDGTAFCITLEQSHGGVIEAHGRPAAAQSVVKLRDVSPERSEIERLTGLLREAEADRATYTEILDKAPFPVWRRRGHTLVWANRAYARAVDAKDADDAVTRRLELENSERSMAALAVRSGEVQSKRRYVVTDGERRAMDIITVPAADGSGGLALDMSAVDAAEEQLERHLNAHRETLDRMRTGVAIFGADMQLVFHNDAFASLWSLPGAFLARSPSDGEILDHLREARRLPEQADYKDWKAKRLALYQEMVDGDDLWHLPDGRTLRVVSKAHPFGGLITLYDDVTDLITLESSYKTLLNVQGATLNHLHEAVAMFGSDGRLKLVNAAFAELWALDDEALADEPHFNLLTRHCVAQLDERHTADGGDWSRIARCITSVDRDRDLEPGRLNRTDGRILDYAVEALPDGRTLLTFLDVTDTARIEQALRERNDALETADRLKSEFVSNVSYQLRTPLNSILGFTEMMQHGLTGELNKRQGEYVGHIMDASGQLRDMVNDILDLAMIDAGTISLDLGTVDVAVLLENARQVAVSRAADSELVITVESPADIGTIVADETRLRQILFNLTTNALQVSAAGGTVTLGATRTSHGVDLWVRDTGPGIPQDQQAAVFERFASGDGARRGAGLGLSLVKSFVELHGGGVTLESEPAKGTRVVCHLPDDLHVAGRAAE